MEQSEERPVGILSYKSAVVMARFLLARLLLLLRAVLLLCGQETLLARTREVGQSFDKIEGRNLLYECSVESLFYHDHQLPDDQSSGSIR